MVPCLSQATTLPHPFADDLAGVADGGGTHVELWLTKLEKHLETNSLADARALLGDKGLTPLAASYQGGLLQSQGEERKAHFDHLRRRLDLCQALGVPTLVVAADFAARPDPAGLQRAVVSLAQAAQWAAGYGVGLALEFRGTDAVCNNLETAVQLVEACREPNAGVCLDLFHYYKGPSKADDLDRLTAANLRHVQVCDVAGVPRELMTDADRVFPGEGDFRLGPVFDRLRHIGYAGAVSLELMNPTVWRCKPSQVAELGLTALHRLLEPRSPAGV
jgi:sugar phosphate isomerase/epimerase